MTTPESLLEKARAATPPEPGRLIAAAPALYDALVAAKRELWMLNRHSFNLSDFKNFAVVQQIDAALTQAEGRAR